MWLKYAKNLFDPEAIEIANKTARGCGAIGEKAIVPRIVAEIATQKDKILDFGAGPKALHAKQLQQQGLDVSAYDFGNNLGQDHDVDALTKQFNIVYASNVANVQSSLEMLRITLQQIFNSVSPGGKAIINLPSQPRKSKEINAQVLFNELSSLFAEVTRIGGTKQAPVFLATKAY